MKMIDVYDNNVISNNSLGLYYNKIEFRRRLSGLGFRPTGSGLMLNLWARTQKDLSQYPGWHG